jgi:YggT family protein
MLDGYDEGDAMGIFIALIQWLVQLFTIIVIVQVFLSYFMSPFHPVRQTIDQLVNPFLHPIQRIIPPVGGLDFSPVVLIILVQVIGSLLSNLLRAL